MKKGFQKEITFTLLSFILLTLLSTNFALADNHDVGADAAQVGRDAAEIGGTVSSAIGGFFTGLFGEGFNITNAFFAFLLWVVIKSITDVAFKKSNSFMKGIIPILIAVISLVAIPAGFLDSATLGYGALGTTIITIIPFLAVLIFSVRTDSLFMARLTWLVFITYYVIFYSYAVYEAAWATSNIELFVSEAWPHLLALFIGVFAFFGIKGIRGLVFKGEIDALKEKADEVAAIRKIGVQGDITAAEVATREKIDE